MPESVYTGVVSVDYAFTVDGHDYVLLGPLQEPEPGYEALGLRSTEALFELWRRTAPRSVVRRLCDALGVALDDGSHGEALSSTAVAQLRTRARNVLLCRRIEPVVVADAPDDRTVDLVSLAERTITDEGTAETTEAEHWVSVTFIDEFNQPLAEVDVEVQLPDGSSYSGRTDADGELRIEGVRQPGECSVSATEPAAEAS